MLKNSSLNLIGMGAPLLVAIIVIPQLIDILGNERFGFLTVIWVVVSYFGLFDMGLGRALTLLICREIASGDSRNINGIIWTAIISMLVLGIVMGFLLVISSSFWLQLIGTDVGFKELFFSVLILGFSVPLVVLTTGYRGVLEAKSLFIIINVIRLPMGVYTFIAPLIIANIFGANLFLISISLLFGRLLALFPHVIFAHRAVESFKIPIKFEKEHLFELFKMGGWMTVSNIVSPLMSYVDRVFVGFILGASFIAYYAVPQEIVMRLGVISAAFTSVLFPRLISTSIISSLDMKRVYYKSLFGIFILMFVVVGILLCYSTEIIELWLPNDFSENSVDVLSVLLVGMFFATVATVPFTFIQANGYSKITATFHLLELPVFLVLIYFLTLNVGVVGAAFAWLLRNLLDLILLLIASSFLLKESNNK